ncbi:MAG: hypothetical protein AB3N13_08585 [Arenibacterium sp.]
MNFSITPGDRPNATNLLRDSDHNRLEFVETLSNISRAKKKHDSELTSCFKVWWLMKKKSRAIG